jgi:phosphomannomutase
MFRNILKIPFSTLKPSKKILLFDLHGTIVQPNQKILPPISQSLLHLKYYKNYDLGIVSAASMNKIKRLLFDSYFYFSFLFSENASQLYSSDSLPIYQNFLYKHPDYEIFQRLSEDTQLFLKHKIPNFNPKNHIFMRDSMLYIHSFSLDSLKYQTQHHLELCKNIYSPNLVNKSISILASRNSLSIQPIEWNKINAIYYLKNNDYNEIHYFGDQHRQYHVDYQIMNSSDVIPHRVKNPFDTLQILKSLY